jgi:phosphate transport system substrate-binding protein
MRKSYNCYCIILLLLTTIVVVSRAGAQSAGSTIKIDGSSTVYPITEAVAEEFQGKNLGAKVIVGISGTGGGFKKFVAGEIDISEASRPIKPAEIKAAAEKGIEFIELPVAYDALSVVVNPKNTWADKLTVKELAKIWAPESQDKVMKWSEVRAGWPDIPLKLFGPGTDSGTFDYFTEAVVGREKASRGDYTSSEDDNIVVQGVAGNPGALGYFGLAYYEGNHDKLRVVPIDDEKDENGKGAIVPSAASVVAGNYVPLSRPLLIYVRKAALSRPEVKKFVEFYLDNASGLAREIGYVELPGNIYSLAKKRLSNVKTGTVFGSNSISISLEKLYADN